MNKKFLNEIATKVIAGLLIAAICFGANWCRQTSNRLERIESKLGITPEIIALKTHE